MLLLDVLLPLLLEDEPLDVPELLFRVSVDLLRMSPLDALISYSYSTLPAVNSMS